jgi:hypothetical protein
MTEGVYLSLDDFFEHRPPAAGTSFDVLGTEALRRWKRRTARWAWR